MTVNRPSNTKTVSVIEQPHSNGQFSLAARLASLAAAEFEFYWDGLRSSFLVRELSYCIEYTTQLAILIVNANQPGRIPLKYQNFEWSCRKVDSFQLCMDANSLYYYIHIREGGLWIPWRPIRSLFCKELSALLKLGQLSINLSRKRDERNVGRSKGQSLWPECHWGSLFQKFFLYFRITDAPTGSLMIQCEFTSLFQIWPKSK